VWDFAPTGLRRTQSLLGGILGTEPFHWSGDVPDMTSIMINTFMRRMGGRVVTPEEVDAIAGWIDRQPAPELPVRDGEAVVRGMTVFTESGCASCHSGPKLTNNENADVGTGGSFQVPALLGVAHRAPFMHDGCAATLADAVAGCGPADAHGATSALSDGQRADLVTYLESL
jgi:CxxC motif-containing protein (DUF1111 family)